MLLVSRSLCPRDKHSFPPRSIFTLFIIAPNVSCFSHHQGVVVFFLILSPDTSKNLFISILSDYFILSIFLQQYISKLSKYFCSIVSEPSIQCNASNITSEKFLNSVFSLLIKGDIFLLNAFVSMGILVLMYLVQ